MNFKISFNDLVDFCRLRDFQLQSQRIFRSDDGDKDDHGDGDDDDDEYDDGGDDGDDDDGDDDEGRVTRLGTSP